MAFSLRSQPIVRFTITFSDYTDFFFNLRSPDPP